MNKNSNDDYKLSILVDKKHGTYYCVDSKGRSYIKTERPKEERKR